MDKEKTVGRRWKLRYEKKKINYRIHNPNTAAATADYILKILIDANSEKVERAIRAAADQVGRETECDDGDFA